MTILENLRSDPFERGDEAILYDKLTSDHVFIQVPAQGIVAQWLQSLKQFPPRAKSASFGIDQIVASLMPKG